MRASASLRAIISPCILTTTIKDRGTDCKATCSINNAWETEDFAREREGRRGEERKRDEKRRVKRKGRRRR